MAWIVRHNDESVREGYIRNGGKEVKLFTSALKAFQCNNRIVMTQRKHLDDFLRGRIIGRLECGQTQLEVSEELGIAQSVISRLWQRFQDDGLVLQSDSRRTLIWRVPGTRYHQENTTKRHRYGGDGWLVWGGFILGSRTDLHVQTMTGHIYRDVILEQHVRLFRGAMGAEFLFMHDNARPHRANIVGECLQSEDITRMDWPAYSPDLNPIEHVWDMLGRRIAARQPPPTYQPELRRALLDEWCNISQDQIDNLILSMPRRFSTLFFSFTVSGRGGLVALVMSSKPACHEFEPSTTEDPLYRWGRCRLNLSRIKRPPVGVVVRRGSARSGVIVANSSRVAF
ncbi:transposable element Tc3 transposase [Trichonephila clavipes]|nr:transposable element Tc3 transposase [Trichonephila clavipes]